MIKKKLLTIVAVCALITSSISSGALAATTQSTKNSTSVQAKKAYASYRDTLTKYVSVQADGTFSLNVPENIKKKIPANVLSKMEKGMEYTNTLIKKGELKANAINKTASPTSANSYSILEDDEVNQEKIVRHWNGDFDLYLNSSDANKLANTLQGTGSSLDFLSRIPGVSTVVGLLSDLSSLQGSEIGYANSDGNGVIIYYTWSDGDAYSGYVYSGVVSQ